ncbi:MAG TPA: acetyl-CoA carboxylase carboxyltransferase subunit alpha/beta [Thermomicrobiaceae bacterium]|nr:acetyl-CoA carboxylase carboxyltransferase subunit alpha/beta [Thermomicrobiaceae bacterium]
MRTDNDELGTCRQCGAAHRGDEQYRRYRVCSNCGYHDTLGAPQRIELLVDAGSFEEFNRHLVSVDPLIFADRLPYPTRVLRAREHTGLTEAAVTGTARIAGHEVILAVLDFRFLGGSMGSVVGEKLTSAFERAAEKKLPIITIAASGGARMQEGMLSLVQLAKTAAAAKRVHDDHVLYISVLTNPTTGGIFASFASQGDITLAEPHALIGFAGPRVIRQTSGREEIDSHSAEFLFRHGFVDKIVERMQLRDTLATILQLVDAHAPLEREERPAETPERAPINAWEIVQIARRADRPTALDYIHRTSPQFVELHGDRIYGDDPAIVGGIGEIDGRGVIFIGTERGHGEAARRGGQALPEGYRKAKRLMELAQRLELPVITLIDTPGAYLGEGAEERGLAIALSECLATMSVIGVPTVATIIGEGGSGGALALGVGDRVLMQERAIYSVIAPEGAAAILYRDAARAPEVAESLKLTAADLLKLSVIDAVVPEPEGGAHANPELATGLLKASIVDALAELVEQSPGKLVRERYRKFRRMGQTNTLMRELIAAEVSEWSARLRGTLETLRDYLPFTDAEPEAAVVLPGKVEGEPTGGDDR